MSSEQGGAELAGRCLFCSLGCQLQLQEFAPQRWRPVYSGDGAGQLCARGQMVADLLHQPSRLYRPSGRSGDVGLSDAVRDMAHRLHRGRADGLRLLVWLDGNVALEDLAAAHRFCADLQGRARLLVHLPPHELGVIEGLDAAGVPQADPQDWAHADAFLIVGNPLTTHPPVARHLMRWGKGRAETPMVVVDSIAGVTGTYAPNCLVCRPGYEYWIVAAMVISAGVDGETEWLPKHDLLQRVLKDSGVDLEGLNRAASQLRSARHPAVIVAPASGGTERWRALVAMAATWAKKRKGLVSVLTQSANAMAVSRYTRRHDINYWAAACMEDSQTDIELLLVVGWDPSSGYPSAHWRPIADRARHVVLANAFPPANADWIDALIPLALNPEVGGTYILADGRSCQTQPIMPPPLGVPSISELFAMLGQWSSELGGGQQVVKAKGVNISEEDIAATPMSSGAVVPAPPAWDEANARIAVLVADPMQYLDGQMTRHSRWSQRLSLLPELWIGPADARALGLRDGVITRIKNNQGEAKVRIVVARNQPEFGGCFADAAPRGHPTGWWAVSGCFAEIRRLASWRFEVPNESAQAGTIDVNIAPAVEGR